MFVGKKYQLIPETRAFPRYQFYRRELNAVFTRVDMTLVKNNLPDFISQGKVTWAHIQDAVRECIDKTVKVSLHVFAANEAHLKNIKGDLIRDKSIIDGTKLLPGELIEKKSVQWDLFIKRRGSEFSPEFAPEVVIYIKGQKENEQNIESQMRALNEIQQDHLVIYDVNKKTSFLYKSHKEEEDKILYQNIEFILVRNIVVLLEYIEDFISKFIPGRVDRELSSSNIKEKIITQLQECLRNEHVLKDFLPVDFDEDQYEGELKTKDMSTMLTKAQKEEAIFQIKVRSFISRKTKCEYCDLTSKLLGVPVFFMNELLGEDLFNFEEKIQQKLTYNRLPRWPVRYDLGTWFRGTAYFCGTVCNDLFPEFEKYLKGMYAVLRSFKKDQYEIHGLLRSVPRAVTKAVPRPTRIPRSLQNELIELNDVEACGNLYGVLTVIMNKQPTSEQRSEIEAIIKNHNFTNAYDIAVTDGWWEHGAIIEPGSEIICDFIEGGKEKLCADLKDECKELPENMRGTLGCFVESKTGEDLYGVTCYHCVNEKYCKGNIRAQTGHEEIIEFGTRSYKLYEKYTLDIALIKVNNSVKRDCQKAIVKANGGIEIVGDWKFSTSVQQELEALPVYKKGMASGTTCGIIVGSEFKTRHMKDLEKRGFGEHFNIFIEATPRKPEVIYSRKQPSIGDTTAGGTEKTLIYSRKQPSIGDTTAGGTEKTYFSRDGDSGSVVCMEVPGAADEEIGVEVVSLLCGSINLTDTLTDGNVGEIQASSTVTYSYSCHMRMLLNELTKQAPGCPELKEANE